MCVCLSLCLCVCVCVCVCVFWGVGRKTLCCRTRTPPPVGGIVASRSNDLPPWITPEGRWLGQLVAGSAGGWVGRCLGGAYPSWLPCSPGLDFFFHQPSFQSIIYSFLWFFQIGWRHLGVYNNDSVCGVNANLECAQGSQSPLQATLPRRLTSLDGDERIFLIIKIAICALVKLYIKCWVTSP